MSFKELISRNLKLLESPNPKPRKTRTGRKLSGGESSDHEVCPNSDIGETLGQKCDPVTEA
ncbi:MAG: hypothetical protein IPK68_12350 [Bdellovibrionales bacterium]|nr:hypothetical protein [Bdellovibrionales bacterium]